MRLIFTLAVALLRNYCSQEIFAQYITTAALIPILERDRPTASKKEYSPIPLLPAIAISGWEKRFANF
jgi:hypothetical protein